jgi:hypothetical protein
MLFSKNSKKCIENKILKILAIINLGSLLCEAAGMFLGNNYEKFKLLNDFSLRLMLVLYISWFSMFVFYVLNIAKKNHGIKMANNKLMYAVSFISLLAVIFLPIVYNTNDEGVIIYSTGAAVQVVYYFVMLSQTISLFIMFKHSKQVKVSNYSSLFALIILSAFAAAIQSKYPSLLLLASTETFVLHLANYANNNKLKQETKK